MLGLHIKLPVWEFCWKLELLNKGGFIIWNKKNFIKSDRPFPYWVFVFSFVLLRGRLPLKIRLFKLGKMGMFASN